MSWPLLSSAPRATITWPFALSVGDAGLEGRPSPQVERVGRLHVVVAVEEHVRRAGRRLAAVVRDDHGMAGRGHDAGIEADVAELARRTSRRRVSQPAL